jgi:hypothetical protein
LHDNAVSRQIPKMIPIFFIVLPIKSFHKHSKNLPILHRSFSQFSNLLPGRLLLSSSAVSLAFPVNIIKLSVYRKPDVYLRNILRRKVKKE